MIAKILYLQVTFLFIFVLPCIVASVQFIQLKHQIHTLFQIELQCRVGRKCNWSFHRVC